MAAANTKLDSAASAVPNSAVSNGDHPQALRWLVFGGKGYIGSEIVKHLQNAGQIVLDGGRVTCAQDPIQDILKHGQVDRIVCSLGRTHGGGINSIDYLQKGEGVGANIRDNLEAPLWVMEAAKAGSAPEIKKDIPVLYIGTGCIYTYDVAAIEAGEEPPVYTEDDAPNFGGSAYSAVKAGTDQIMGAAPHVINARIRMPISILSHPRDFITKILGYPKITSLTNSMTVLDDILPRMIALAHSAKAFGSFNAVNEGPMDHAEIIGLYERATGERHPFELEKFSTQAARLPAPRSNNVLSTAKLAKALKDTVSGDVQKLYGITSEVPLLRASVSSLLLVRAQALGFGVPRVVLITGGCGFIGSNFVNHWLRAHPQDVVVNVDRMDECASYSNVSIPGGAEARYSLVECDVGNTAVMFETMTRLNVTHVVHFAARSQVDKSFVDAVDFTVSNVVGTHGLLEAARMYGKIRLFVHISTDEVYGGKPVGSCREDTPLNPSNPYAATKAAAEYLVRSYGESFGLKYVITRGNNTYGTNQYTGLHATVIPSFVTRLLNGQKMRVHGKGLTRRMFLHVDDTVSAVETIMLRGQVGHVYNIGSRDELTIIDVARDILELVKPGAALEDWVEYVPDRVFNDSRYDVDATALAKLGWVKRVSWRDGMVRTINMYKSKLFLPA